MFKQLYKKQLALLEKDADAFSKANPELAGLITQAAQEPDTARLMQGFAYLTADLYREVDNNFPKLLNCLSQAIVPHQIKALPSATIMEFTPKSNLLTSVKVKKQSELFGKNNNGENIKFRTTKDTIVYPLSVKNSSLLCDEEKWGGESKTEIKIDLSTNGLALSEISIDEIDFYIDDSTSRAADLLYFILHEVEDVFVVSGKEKIKKLNPRDKLISVFEKNDVLYPDNEKDIPVYKKLIEFYCFPEKFLFFSVSLKNVLEAENRESFSLVFSGPSSKLSLNTLKDSCFKLHCVPAVNIFKGNSEAKIIEAYDEEIHIQAAISHEESVTTDIYNIDNVQCVSRGDAEGIIYENVINFERSSESNPGYQVNYKPSINRNGYEKYITLTPRLEDLGPKKRVLKCELQCFNGVEAEQLNPGDLCQSLGETPSLVTFENIDTPSTCYQPSLDNQRLWSIISDASMNIGSLGDIHNLKKRLRAYVPRDSRSESSYQKNVRMIESIMSCEISNKEKIYNQMLIRGLSIRLQVKSQEFPTFGMYFMFGMLLEQFFCSHAPINHYTELTFVDYYSGEQLIWPARLGTRALI